MARLILIMIGTLTMAGPVAASSTCYLYEGDAYWICLREERADQQDREELLEQIKEDTQQAVDSMGEME